MLILYGMEKGKKREKLVEILCVLFTETIRHTARRRKPKNLAIKKQRGPFGGHIIIIGAVLDKCHLPQVLHSF